MKVWNLVSENDAGFVVSTCAAEAMAAPPAGPELRTFRAVLAQNVRAYGSAEIVAPSAEAALEILRAQLVDEGGAWDSVTQVEWYSSTGATVVSLEAADGTVCACDVELEHSEEHRTLTAEELAAALAAHA